MGYIGKCGSQGRGFSALLVKWGMIFASSLELSKFFLEEAIFFISINNLDHQQKPFIKMFRATVPAATVINRVSHFWSGHKQGRENYRF